MRECARDRTAAKRYTCPTPLSADKLRNDLAHLGHLAVHALGQGNEVAGAVEVLGFVLGLEILVAGQIVIEIAGGELQGHDQTAVGERGDFVCGKKVLGVGQESGGEGPEDVHVQADLVELEAG